ncbi:hypothetical protein L228DRAFT_43266 [Xylona heveae TC161]|uniref:Uncharacterized protein n=1 Tax=Xylona heveae (strain CBS 132557 / TC161) TaxID=1328760 RepID=A0A164ZRM3_XYLHT|nr:hypothetical protein L228DRAFT_43266 [Xylona heveae TC161]KZF19424.1 hypothetical protein L228DRAFT_43266 [Xylona heveae TC161]
MEMMREEMEREREALVGRRERIDEWARRCWWSRWRRRNSRWFGALGIWGGGQRERRGAVCPQSKKGEGGGLSKKLISSMGQPGFLVSWAGDHKLKRMVGYAHAEDAYEGGAREATGTVERATHRQTRPETLFDDPPTTLVRRVSESRG